MKFLIVIPAHNEEKNIFFCLKSLQNQKATDFSAIVVNDGSSDQTAEIVEQFTNQDKRFTLLNLESSSHAPGAKVVRTFYKGLELVKLDDFDVICKFDADVVFPDNYLAEIEKVYRELPTAGMVSGIVKIKRNIFEKKLAFDFRDEKKQWIFENISSKNHVRGPIKSYRRSCFVAIGGLRPVLGWDNIDVMLAKMHGFQVVTLKNIWVKHLRPTAYKYKTQKAEKLGEYFYNIGLNAPLAAISAAKSSFKNNSATDFFITMQSFFKQRKVRELSLDEIRHIRNLRWKQIFGQE